MKLLDAIKTYADAKPQAEAFRSLDHSLTYGELWDLSERVASGIQKHTADGSKAPVLVYGHMEPNMIVSFLGSVKAGRPYIPVDVSIPAERIVKIIESSGAELLISVSGDAVDTGSNLIKTVTPEELAADGDADLSRENVLTAEVCISVSCKLFGRNGFNQIASRIDCIARYADKQLCA